MLGVNFSDARDLLRVLADDATVVVDFEDLLVGDVLVTDYGAAVVARIGGPGETEDTYGNSIGPSWPTATIVRRDLLRPGLAEEARGEYLTINGS